MSYASARVILEAKKYHVFEKSAAAKCLKQETWNGSDLHLIGRKSSLLRDWHLVIRFEQKHGDKMPSADASEVIKCFGTDRPLQMNLAGSGPSAATDITGSPTALCLIGPVWAVVPYWTGMKESGSQALSSLMDFEVPKESDGYSARKIQVLMLAGWKESTRECVELANLTAYPAALWLPGGSAYK